MAHEAAWPEIDGAVLIVEDNVLIALDTGEMMSELGVTRVHTAGDVEDALRLLASQPIALAILDVNLGAETSLPVAQGCAERGIPFLLATGFAANAVDLAGFPEAPLLEKPFSPAQVRAALAGLTRGPD